MRRFQKKQLLDIMKNVHAIHQQSREKLEQKDYEAFHSILEGCQKAAIKIGETIEKIEGEGAEAVICLERYCESLYQLSTQIEEVPPQRAYKNMEASLLKAENALKHMPERIEAVFLPYKASMWDSLESIWMTADKDPNCDTYVIPIPYYDKNPDGTFRAVHYEDKEFPDYVPITHYNDYNFENRRPDMIYIHNPYDQYNNVTSVHPFFYSLHLKEFTDMLVYVPYYSTSGGMNPGQGQCSAYYCADYIVVQAEKYQKFFASDIPKEKLLPLGSPKFDRVVNICKNPPEPPLEWKEKMAGKKVYFYNTSINGMLANTPVFLRKMEYVFSCFTNRQDACLLWRPHPLLESSFDSMRSEFRPFYDALKKFFLESNFGIYDNTPDITDTIALCDAYIGDSGSSVTSLFGIVGKPVFILNNFIDSAPEEDDWRGEIIRGFHLYASEQWRITQGNKLYYSPANDFRYEYYCDLMDYAYGDYYLQVIHIQDKDYVCPFNAQDILVVGDHKIQKRITLKRCVEQKAAFYAAADCGKYLFLIPNNYPALVRYDTESGEIRYFEDNRDIYIKQVQGKQYVGGHCVLNGYLFIASPSDNYVLAIHAETGKGQVLTTNAVNKCGCMALFTDGTDLWFLPYFGNVITRWNPETGDVHEYADYPEGFGCKHPILGFECMERPFMTATFYENYIYCAPWWANMYIRLDIRSGMITEWIPPFAQAEEWKNGYYHSGYHSGGKAYFLHLSENTSNNMHLLFSVYDRKIYNIFFEANECEEVIIKFNKDDLCENEMGFCENSEWRQYDCQENAFNSLTDFLDGNITGNQFDKERAIRAYEKIAANNDGTSGTKIYDFVHSKLYE